MTYEAKFNWANWTQPVKNWVCGYEPYLGVVIYDCIPEDKVPLWWDDAYLGPKFDDGELFGFFCSLNGIVDFSSCI